MVDSTPALNAATTAPASGVAIDSPRFESATTSRDFATELQSKVVAIEVNTSRFGQSRQIEQRHRDGVAAVLETKKGSTTTSKKLYPKNEPHVKRVNSLLNEAVATWKRMTVGYRKGVRLLKKEHFADFIREMDSVKAELDAALIELDQNRDEVLEQCREFLGEKLFDINQYPESYQGHVRVSWSVYNFKPNDDLLKLAPETYERERQLVARRFQAAVDNFEVESREQLSDMIDALLDKLNPEDGKKVTYTESATTNLREFFDRFKTFGVSNDEQLKELIGEAEEALAGTTMAQLKRSTVKRRDINESFKAVKSRLDSLVVDAPTRSFDLDDLD